MGAKIGKDNELSTSENIPEHGKPVISTLNNHANGLANGEKPTKQKKARQPSKKRVDKHTNTNGGIVSTIRYAKHTFEGSSYENVLNEVLNNDILEFRNACIRRGIILPEANNHFMPTINVQEIINAESTNTHEATIVVKTDEHIQNEEPIIVENTSEIETA